MSNQLITFEQFKAGFEAAGAALDEYSLRKLAYNSENVDNSTIPDDGTAKVSVVEYTPTKAKDKTPRLYAKVEATVGGKPGQTHFGRLESLRRDIARMEATLPALKELEADLSNGAENTEIPQGWVVDGENADGFSSSK